MINLKDKVFTRYISEYNTKEFKILDNNQNILPLGSCFLDILCYHLKNNNFKILGNKNNNKNQYFQLKFDYGNFYNPLNLFHNLERVIKRKINNKKSDFFYNNKTKSFQNLYLKTRSKSSNLKNLFKRTEEIDEFFYNEIKKAKVIILSFDSNECWIDKKTNKCWYTFYGDFLNNKVYNDAAYLKILNYKDVKSILIKIIDILNSVGYKKKFILINSSQNMRITFSNKQIYLANSYRKLLFGNLFHELHNINKNIFYFPSFEILDQFSHGKVFRNDNIHIKGKAIQDYIIEPFKKFYS